jgi:hypothetical protein
MTTPAPTNEDFQPATTSRRDGFALPTAILVISLVTIGLVASFSATGSEIANSSSQRSQAKAYSIAQYGLEQFLARRSETSPTTFCTHCLSVNGTGSGNARTLVGVLPTTQETLAVKIPRSSTDTTTVGLAVVKATPVMLNNASGSGVYLITSTGYDSTSKLYGSTKAKIATRTVGVFATYTRSNMNVLAGWTSLSGIDINGNAATISGIDACGSGHNVAGLSVPLKSNGTADMSKNNNWNPLGSPPYDTTKTFSQESASMKIDWVNIQAGKAMPADIDIGTGYSGTFPSTATFNADTTWYPVIHVHNGNGNYSLPNAGRGTMIVDGSLTISGSNQWNGIILVGGQITSNGNNVSSGATISGLDLLTGGHVNSSIVDSTTNATANGTKTYVYNSCDVSKATSSMSRYYIMPNSWMDNVAGY